jgi:hypothetical protein
MAAPGGEGFCERRVQAEPGEEAESTTFMRDFVGGMLGTVLFSLIHTSELTPSLPSHGSEPWWSSGGHTAEIPSSNLEIRRHLLGTLE